MPFRAAVRNKVQIPMLVIRFILTNTEYYSKVWILSYGAKPPVTAQAARYTR